MVVLVVLITAAAAVTALLPTLGWATPNEGLMLASFFLCKAIWFAYLAFLIEWLVRITRRPQVAPAKRRSQTQRRVVGF